VADVIELFPGKHDKRRVAAALRLHHAAVAYGIAKRDPNIRSAVIVELLAELGEAALAYAPPPTPPERR
jgi:hypothetical protein